MSEIRVNCPQCEIEVIWSEQSKYRPFCSERCKLIDLGEWADENRRIAGSLDESSLAELIEQN